MKETVQSIKAQHCCAEYTYLLVIVVKYKEQEIIDTFAFLQKNH